MSLSVLVLGITRQAITVVRSLGLAGHKVIVGGSEDHEFIDFSRFTSGMWRHPPVRAERCAFLEELRAFLEPRRDIRYVFPTGETMIRALVASGAGLPNGATLVTPPREIVETCLDKAQSYELIQRLGVPLPATVRAYRRDEVVTASISCGFPCVIKPNGSAMKFFGQKALICKSADEVEERLPDWPPGNEFVIVQRYVKGYRHNCQFIANNGVCLAYFEHKVFRTDRSDGSGCMVDGISIPATPELKSHCSEIVQELSYTGAGCVQFLVDNTDPRHHWFLELNPRLDAGCSLPFYCGYDFPRLTLDLFRARNGELDRLPEGPRSYSTWKRGNWLLGDIYGLQRELETRDLRLRSFAFRLLKMMHSFLRARCHALWSWRDPLPALFLYAAFPTALGRRLARIAQLTPAANRSRRPAEDAHSRRA